MILTLRIHRAGPGHYHAAVLDGPEELGTLHAPTLGAAIQQCAQDWMPGLSGMHVWYEHVCAGTLPLSSMRTDPHAIAQQLMVLHGSLR